MRVFVTGGTGFIGSAIVAELLDSGHEVLGLARSDAAAEALAQAGAAALAGDLTNPEKLVAGARACDGVIHTAFIHDFSHFDASVEADRRAVETMAKALEGSAKPLVIASGTAPLALHASRPGHTSAETDESPPGALRAAAEAIVMAAADCGVRGSVVRLPPTVHGAGDHAFIPRLIAVAREKGASAYVGDGANRWPAVHRLDAARLFRLALEKAPTGSRLHAVTEEGVPLVSIAQAIGECLGVPVESITEGEAQARFGSLMGRFVALDNPTSSELTRDWLGWRPREPGLLTDIRQGGYLA